MRPVSGFERPVVQWLFVALSLVLIVAAGGAAWVARHAKAGADAARAADETGRLERQQLEAQLARERSAREALTLELARQRETGSEPVRVMPTLTLAPVATRGATPPPPAVTMQHATQVIELRLILPPGAERYTRFDVVLRDWSSGSVAWSRGGLLATTVDRQRMVAAFVTGDLFKAGPYELLLSGVTRDGHKEEAASYEVAFK
jgi:hypothetical protein